MLISAKIEHLEHRSKCNAAINTSLIFTSHFSHNRHDKFSWSVQEHFLPSYFEYFCPKPPFISDPVLYCDPVSFLISLASKWLHVLKKSTNTMLLEKANGNVCLNSSEECSDMALIWIRANYPRSQPERSSSLLHTVPDMLLLGNRKEAALPQIRLKLQLCHKIFKSHTSVIEEFTGGSKR